MVICSLVFSSVSLQTFSNRGIVRAAQMDTTVTVTVNFQQSDFTFDTVSGYDRVVLQDGSLLTAVGEPMLPTAGIRVALPAGMTATAVQVDAVHEQALSGMYTLYPAQPPQSMNAAEDNSFVPPNAAIYRSTASYPTSYVSLTGESDLAGQAMAEITVYPLHYIGASRQVQLLTSLTFTIEGTPGYVCGDYLPTRLKQADSISLTTYVKSLVANPDTVILQTDPKPHSLGVPTGDYDYVIITSSSWVSDFQPLADWKTKKGVPATIVTTDWIYNQGGYNGSNVDKIRAFINDAYSTWGATFFLLGGDTGTVPCDYRTFPTVDSDPVPNDTYYSDFDGDWICEVSVGRASVTGPGTGTGQIGNFINKVLTYEKNPPLTDYAKKAAFFGFDLDSATHAEQCKISIDTHYIPDNWTMTNVYDSDSGNHESNVIAAMNQGQNLLNHADHSAPDYMGTGYIDHGWGIDDGTMDALTNGEKQGILYSMGCDPCAYDNSACIAEHFVRNSNGGGLAFIGNSRYGWYNPGYYNTLSMRFDQYFFKSIFSQGVYQLGTAVLDHKNRAFQNADIVKYCYTEITLLGDPEVPIWTDDPGTLTVNYPTNLPVGTTSFPVTVTDGDNPVDYAVVCLWKGSEVYLVGTTNADGMVELTPSPTTPGPMSVTVTKHNYLPSENVANAILVNDTSPETPAMPSGPTNGFTDHEYTFSSSTTDPDTGNQVWYQWQFGGTFSDWYGPYTSGTTVEASCTWVTAGTYAVRVKAKDAVGLQSPWSPPLTVTIIRLRPNLTLGPVVGGLLGVSSEVFSIGDTPATNITWNVSVQGGFVLTKRTASGTIGSLDVGVSQPIKNMPLIGLGKVTITITAKADGVSEISKNAAGVILLFWVGIS